MHAFDHLSPTRIVFGSGTIRQAGQLARGLGRRALIVTGRSKDRAAPLLDNLREHGVEAMTTPVAREPDIATIQRAAREARDGSIELVIGLGGGSALDAAKAIAALATNTGDVLDYLEVVGRTQPLEAPPLPCIAIPTTAGTGSEVTRNAVIASPEHRVKASLRSPLMFPRIALVDPELTWSLPPAVTAATGLDALTQLIEAYVSSRANPMTDALCLAGIPRAARALRRAFDDGSDAEARADMAFASLLSGIALANAGLGAVHGFAGPIGGMFDAPHGGICAVLLPHVMAANLRALRARNPGDAALMRFDRVARLLTGRDSAGADEGVQWLGDLVASLGVPPLRAYGVTVADAAAIAAAAGRASSMKANPVPLSRGELEATLAAAV